MVPENTHPKFYKPRPVPIMLKPKVEDELKRLQDAGIISPVRSSPWAAPVVPVLKKDGKIRLCGDYKLTINQVLLFSFHLEHRGGTGPGSGRVPVLVWIFPPTYHVSVY
jgi:hypothetical protein